jgi:putative tryptophan/tyrosine transport system substrate-binding protein
MRRREFIAGIGSAAAWPLAAHAQQGERVRRIGILSRGDATERILQDEWGALREGLTKLGWIEGCNVRFDRRFSADDPYRLRAYADELVRLNPDVMLLAPCRQPG